MRMALPPFLVVTGQLRKWEMVGIGRRKGSGPGAGREKFSSRKYGDEGSPMNVGAGYGAEQRLTFREHLDNCAEFL